MFYVICKYMLMSNVTILWRVTLYKQYTYMIFLEIADNANFLLELGSKCMDIILPQSS